MNDGWSFSGQTNIDTPESAGCQFLVAPNFHPFLAPGAHVVRPKVTWLLQNNGAPKSDKKSSCRCCCCCCCCGGGGGDGGGEEVPV